MRRYIVRMDGADLGSSDLEWLDQSMGVAVGRFFPLPAFDGVAPIFALFVDAKTDGERARYYAARDALPLQVIDTRRASALPASTVHIADFRVQLDDPSEIELEVILDDVDALR